MQATAEGRDPEIVPPGPGGRAGRDERSTVLRLAEGAYWYLAVGLCWVVATAPTWAVWLLLVPTPSNIPLYALAALAVPPALAASLATWEHRAVDDDPVPVRTFARRYRRSMREATLLALPAAAVLSVLGIDLTLGSSVGGGVLVPVLLVLGVIVMLLTVRAVSICSVLTFRLVDVWRLAAFSLLARPLRALALVSYAVLVIGLAAVVGDYAVLLLASPLSALLWRSERPVLELLEDRFVAPEG